MQLTIEKSYKDKQFHNWLRKVNVFFAPEQMTPMLDKFCESLLSKFDKFGHNMQPKADDNTDVILTTAGFGVPLSWRKAVLFTMRKKFSVRHSPTIFTIVPTTPRELKKNLEYFQDILQNDHPQPEDFNFPGLSTNAYLTLFEQGRRGGPIMAFARLLQSQSKSIRVILVVGEGTPHYAYIFDLVGAHPKIENTNPEAFYTDIVLRMTTALSTEEITNHEVVYPSIPYSEWERLLAPMAMRKSAIEFGKRKFFTEMVRVADLVHVPMIGHIVADQYSEGCFATWEPKINGLISTITGSARPVDKDSITDDELAVIVGVREDGLGAKVKHVTNKRNDPPSSEAVEMMEMDSVLSRIKLGPQWDFQEEVPIVRSKLHGHRGIAEYNSKFVEYVPLDPQYHHFPVSCATEAQAKAIKSAFQRSQSLQRPEDPREVVFTVLPGHGILIAEKWVPDKEPFQIIYEYMDSHALKVENHIPQGTMSYESDGDGLMKLRSP